MSPPPALLELLQKLAAGELSVERAAQSASDLLAGNPTAGDPNDASGRGHHVEAIDGAVIDLGRQVRCGFGEVIFGEGKSAELIGEIVAKQLRAGQDCLVTRIDPTAAAHLRRRFEHVVHHPLARTLRVCNRAIQNDSADESRIQSGESHVAVLTAGSTDAAVAREAVETLRWMGVPQRCFEDVGVAGPQRLLRIVPQIRQAAAVVVIAGMEGALPPTVAGHVAVPVIAVPTSIGYGVNFGGLTALASMLTSCAANVAVVNIDAGFKGGYLAGLIASRSQHA